MQGGVNYFLFPIHKYIIRARANIFNKKISFLTFDIRYCILAQGRA